VRREFGPNIGKVKDCLNPRHHEDARPYRKDDPELTIWIHFLGPTLNVRPLGRLKGERNAIEKLMPGWCATTC
jgi:hypothetical protein